MPDTATRPLPQLEAPNLSDAVRLHASSRPDRVALVERNGQQRRTLTWAEFDRAVDAGARGLSLLGARAGEPVLLAASNTIETVTAWFAALRAGVIATPINPAATATELQRIVAHSQAELLIGEPFDRLRDRDPLAEPFDRLRDRAFDRLEDRGPLPEPVEGPPGVRVVPADELAAPAEDVRVASPLDVEAVAALVYSSGSSGQPRAVMLSHRALIAHCEASWRRGVGDPDAVVLCCLPLFHAFGLNAVLGAAVYAGSTLVLVDGLPDELPDILMSEQVTHLPLIPSALYRLSRHPQIGEACAGIRLVTSGAAPLPSVIADNWRRLTGLPVHQGYGLTEAGPGVASTVGGECRGSTHVGRALPGVEIRIGDGSQPVEPAEVWIRGRNLFSGYWPDGAGGPDADGWFPTGDIGYLDGEELFLIDRVRELIIVSGFNVYPSEVEEVLREHPGVDDAAVLGLPDDRTGERVVAFVTGDAIDVSSVLAHARELLPRYKLPAEVMIIKAMPRSTTGKIRKNLLRDMLDMTDEGDL